MVFPDGGDWHIDIDDGLVATGYGESTTTTLRAGDHHRRTRSHGRFGRRGALAASAGRARPAARACSGRDLRRPAAEEAGSGGPLSACLRRNLHRPHGVEQVGGGPAAGGCRTRGARQARRRARVRGARTHVPGNRLPNGLPPHRLGERGGGRGPDRLRQGVERAARASGAGAPFKPWLLRIVANEAHNRRRQLGRRAALELRATAAHPLGDAAPSPEGAAIGRELRDELLAAVSQPRRARPRRADLPVLPRALGGGDRGPCSVSGAGR